MASAAALGAVGRGFKSLCSDQKAPTCNVGAFLFKKSRFNDHGYTPINRLAPLGPLKICLHNPLLLTTLSLGMASAFALGFMLGFLFIIPIFKRKLEQTPQIRDRDVSSWPTLITQLKTAIGLKDNPISPIFKKLGKKAQAAIVGLRFKQEPDKLLRGEILQALNESLTDRHLAYTRRTLEQLFPKGIHTLRDLALFLSDRITWFIVLGTLVGARLGHILFYEWPKYQKHPLDILKVWEGGLASHGAAIGIMLALFVFQRIIRKNFPELTFVTLLDILAIPTAIAAVWIRIGNFINQEIVGPVTTLPWAVVFGNPVEGRPGLPRHPTQLYEAATYLLTFLLLYFLWKRREAELKRGTLIGLFMICVFGSRFLLSLSKTPTAS